MNFLSSYLGHIIAKSSATWFPNTKNQFAKLNLLELQSRITATNLKYFDPQTIKKLHQQFIINRVATPGSTIKASDALNQRTWRKPCSKIFCVWRQSRDPWNICGIHFYRRQDLFCLIRLMVIRSLPCIATCFTPPERCEQRSASHSSDRDIKAWNKLPSLHTVSEHFILKFSFWWQRADPWFIFTTKVCCLHCSCGFLR